MRNEDARHLLPQPRSKGAAACWAAVSLVASVPVYPLARSTSPAIVVVPLLTAILLTVIIGAWKAAVAVQVEHHYKVLVSAGGLALAVLPLLLSLRDGHTTEPPVAANKGSSSTTAVEPTTSSASTTTVPSPTTAPPTPTTTLAATTSAPTTPASIPPTTTHQLQFVGRRPIRCLDVPSDPPGASAQLSPCGPAATMDWQYIASTGQIRGGGGDHCLALVGPHQDGGLVTKVPCDPSKVGQTWSRDDQMILNQDWGCLDLDGNGDDKTVQISDCAGDPDQLWLFL